MATSLFTYKILSTKKIVVIASLLLIFSVTYLHAQTKQNNNITTSGIGMYRVYTLDKSSWNTLYQSISQDHTVPKLEDVKIYIQYSEMGDRPSSPSESDIVIFTLFTGSSQPRVCYSLGDFKGNTQVRSIYNHLSSTPRQLIKNDDVVLSDRTYTDAQDPRTVFINLKAVRTNQRFIQITDTPTKSNLARLDTLLTIKSAVWNNNAHQLLITSDYNFNRETYMRIQQPQMSDFAVLQGYKLHRFHQGNATFNTFWQSGIIPDNMVLYQMDEKSRGDVKDRLVITNESQELFPYFFKKRMSQIDVYDNNTCDTTYWHEESRMKGASKLYWLPNLSDGDISSQPVITGSKDAMNAYLSKKELQTQTILSLPENELIWADTSKADKSMKVLTTNESSNPLLLGKVQNLTAKQIQGIKSAYLTYYIMGGVSIALLTLMAL